MFIEKDNQLIVNAAVFELIIPTSYASRALFTKEAGYYKLFAVGMGRFFRSSAIYEKSPDSVELKPIDVPVFITTKPSLVETDIMEVPKGGNQQPVYRLIYYLNDVFATSLDYIKSADNKVLMYNLMDDGKADFLPYLTIAKLVESVYYYNGGGIPVPIEAIHAMVAEKCKNPKNYEQDARFMKEVPYAITALNPRESMVTGNVAGMFAFEDVNTALMVAANKKSKGIVDDATTIEKIILTAKV